MNLINARIITMEGKTYPSGYIKIEDGKIAQIGDMSDFRGDGTDLGGATVTPGLIDAHSHIGIWEDSVAFEGDDGNEDTDPATPQLRAIDGINPQDRAFEEALMAGVTTVITGPGSANSIGGQLLAMKTGGVCVDDMVIKSPIGIKAAFGENPKTTYNEKNQQPVTRMGNSAVIRETLFKAKNYSEDLKLWEEDSDHDKPEWDFKCEALLPLMKKEIPLYAHVHRLDDIFTAIRIAKEFDLSMILVHGTDAHLVADRLAKENIPVLSGPILTDRSKVELKNQTDAAPFILTNAGIETAIITDHPETPQKYLPLCAMTAIRAGLDETEALRAITITPAKICGIADRVGSIKEGKDADLVVWNEKKDKPLMVILDGQVVFS